MEHINVMKKNKTYKWHAGAPDDKIFSIAQKELIKKIKLKYNKKSLQIPKFININTKSKIEQVKNLFEIHFAQ